jgi:SmpA / OmlA family
MRGADSKFDVWNGRNHMILQNDSTNFIISGTRRIIIFLKFRQIITLFLIILILLSISSCRPDFARINENLKQVEVGMTTKEVQDLLGRPHYRIGEEQWIYVDSPISQNLPMLTFDLKTGKLVKIGTIPGDEIF